MDIQCPNCNSIDLMVGVTSEGVIYTCRNCGYTFDLSEIDEFSSGDPDDWYELEDAE